MIDLIEYIVFSTIFNQFAVNVLFNAFKNVEGILSQELSTEIVDKI